MQPDYTVYIPSKNRAPMALTPRLLRRWHCPYTLVVEPQELDIYTHYFPDTPILTLPENNKGLIFARNWIWEHSVSVGEKKHWQVDDNINQFFRRYNATRFYVDPSIAFHAVELFTDRYINIALSGMNYRGFVTDRHKYKPFVLNCHVYSNTLIRNDLPFRYRPPANEDVDLCLQALANGFCTVQINAFLAGKLATMVMKGGQTDAAYHGDGRWYMAKALERVWPGVATVGRRWGRPQHMIKDSWKRFDNKLIRRDDIDWANLPKIDELGMELKQVKPIQSEQVKKLTRDYRKKRK